MIKHILLFTVLAFAFFSSPAQNKRAERRAKAADELKQTEALIHTRQFIFVADYVNSSLAPNRSLFTPPNTFMVKNDSAMSDLPFFGRAYHADYNYDGGIKFHEPINDWQIKKNEKKQQLILTIKAKKNNDWFQCTFVIQSNGNATLNISSHNRASISFWGKINRLPDSKDD
jgi:hypothetical protein